MLGALLLIYLADITHIEDLMEQVEWTTLVFFSALFILMRVGCNSSAFIFLLNKAASTLRRRNLKRSFISTVRRTVHTNPSRKRSFLKTLFEREEFENAGFSFSRGRKRV